MKSNSTTPLIPFNRHLGLVEAEDPSVLLELPEGPQYLNHLGTVHAGALLSLADAASGEFLMRQFGSQSGVIAVVRRLESKFRKPASGRIIAKASADQDALARVESDLASKKRVLLPVMVELYDGSGTHILSAKVEWYLQKHVPSRE
ncbi:MAG: PaaI family thioesterase [Chthoniobacteraceae bacterium]